MWRHFLYLALLLSILGSAAAQSPTVRDTQVMLQALGYSPGPIDGLLGQQTIDALEQFQLDSVLPISRTIDAATLDALAERTNSLPDSESVEQVPDASDGRPVAGRLPRSTVQPTVTVESLPSPVQPGPQEHEARAAPEPVAAPSPTPSALPVPSPPVATAPAEAPSSNTPLWWLAVFVLAVIVYWRRKSHQKIRQRNEQPNGSSTDRRPARQVRERTEGRHSADDGFTSGYVTLTEYVDDEPVETSPDGRRFWVPAGRKAVVKRFEIGGMVYVGRGLTSPRTGWTENCLIDPELPVAKRTPDIEGHLLGYYPNYSEIDPHSRLAYLQWLATGRGDIEYSVGFAFLYFYGLERRAMVDECSPGELKDIAKEVARLRELYSESGSFRRYSSALIEAIDIQGGASPSSGPLFAEARWQIPFSVRVAIGRLISEGKPLSADWMLCWWWHHPDSRIRMPAKRTFSEFKQLFELRFNQTFPNGMRVAKPRRSITYVYTAASNTFTKDLTNRLGSVPDIENAMAPIIEVAPIAEQCMDDLSPLSRYLGRNPGGRDTLEGHALLPEDLAALVPNRELDALRDWARRIIKQGEGLVLLDDLILRLEGRPPERVGRKSMENVSDALGRIGIGFAPDPRYALRPPRLGEPVVLFELPDLDDRVRPASKAYPIALISIVLGAYVAHADGDISDREWQRLAGEINGVEGLSEAEKARLNANLKWAVCVPPSVSEFRRHFKDLPIEGRRQIGRIAMAVAGSDGRIDAAEVDALNKLYRALGIDEREVFSELNAISARPIKPASQPVRVLARSAGRPGYKIPAPPAEKKESTRVQSVVLNLDRVKAITADTAAASRVLGRFFAQENEVADLDDEVEGDGTGMGHQLDGLEIEHRSLAVELATRQKWSKDEYSQLASHFRLMPDGALETLNEWAYGKWNEPFLEEDQELVINETAFNSLKAIMQEAPHGAA